VKGKDGKIKDSSIVNFISPKVVDDEEDKIKMVFNTKGQTFIKMKQNPDDTFTMSVNRQGLLHKRQSFLVTITIKDKHNSEGSIHTIMLIVDYKDQTSQAS
jgi:hypothetical protein